MVGKKDTLEDVLGLDQSSGTHRMRFGRLILVGIAALVAISAFVLWVQRSNNPAAQYQTQPVTRGSLTIIVTATGSVQPTNKVDISSELSGTIKKVFVDYNSVVKAGQVLAELDTIKLQARVKSSSAKLAAAKAKVKNVEATAIEKKLGYERKRTLVAKKINSPHDLEIAKAAYDRAVAATESAKAEVAAATADLALNKTNLKKACICSPINGVVLKRNVEPGQTVASSLQAPVLFTIAEDLTKMEVQVDVDEADVGKVKKGQRAIFTVDAYPDKKFPAVIRELHFGSEVVQGVVTYKAVLSTDNSQLLLRPGMTATAEITVKQVSGAKIIPNAALRFSPQTDKRSSDRRSFLQKLLPGRPRRRPPSSHTAVGPDRKVWVLSNGKPKSVAVTIGVTDGRRTQIVKGNIELGQAVIVNTMARKK